MNDNIHNFFLALQIMGQGMLGIFIVLLLIMLIVVLLTKFSKKSS